MGGLATNVEKAHSAQPESETIMVSIAVKPWGQVKIAGRTLNSPARLPLKPGRYTISFGQRGTPHTSRINVTPERRSFQFKVPSED